MTEVDPCRLEEALEQGPQLGMLVGVLLCAVLCADTKIAACDRLVEELVMGKAKQLNRDLAGRLA